jgi:hypothetical protein
MLKIPLMAALAVLLCLAGAADEWHITTVDSEGDAGKYASVAVHNGNPAVAYHDGTHGDLRYAWRDSDLGWHLETVDDSAWTGEQCSLAFSASGRPGISYVDAQGNAVMFAYKDGQGWHKEVVDPDGYTGFNTSLAFNGQYPAIAYGQVANGLGYAYKDGEGWHKNVIDELVEFQSCSLAVLDGEPAIAYNDASPYGCGGLRYAYMDDGNWNYETVDSTYYGTGEYCSLAFDWTLACISYHDPDSGSLMFARRNGPESWQITTVDEGADSIEGLYTSLAFHESTAHISYYESSAGDLKYARLDNDGWHLRVLATDGDLGKYSSLGLSSDGLPMIGFYNADSKDLMFAEATSLSERQITLQAIPAVVELGEEATLVAFVSNADGPVSGMPVSFAIEWTNTDATLSDDGDFTNESGIASVKLLPGSEPGFVRVSAFAQSWEMETETVARIIPEKPLQLDFLNVQWEQEGLGTSWPPFIITGTARVTNVSSGQVTDATAEFPLSDLPGTEILLWDLPYNLPPLDPGEFVEGNFCVRVPGETVFFDLWVTLSTPEEEEGRRRGHERAYEDEQGSFGGQQGYARGR